MPRVVFTSNLARHLACPPAEVPGATVRVALEAVFAANPRLGRYVLDDQGGLRANVNVFVDGELVRDAEGLSDTVSPTGEIFVLQALAGG